MDNSEKNVRIFVYSCLSFKKNYAQHELNKSYPEYLCEHSLILVHDQLFPIVDLRYVFTFLKQKVNSFIKSVEEVSPQITISESKKSGREKRIFSRFTQKQLQIHDGIKNSLNTFSYQLLGGRSFEISTNYYVKMKMI